MKKKVIATGISGLVGSRIVELLNDKYLFISFSLDTGIDITNKNLLEKTFQKYKEVKTVLHLAAFTDVDACFRQSEDKKGSCYQVNVIGSKNIAQLCHKTGKYLVHISTDFVFDGKNPPVHGYSENDKPNPIEWYGKTKLLAEQEVKKSTCLYSILRIAFPYKAKPANPKIEPVIKLDLVRKIINKLGNKESLPMFTDQIITPTFIDDIAKIVDCCFEVQPEGIFHCVGLTSLSPYNLANKIADIFNLNKSLIKKASFEELIKQNPKGRPRQKNMTLSNNKLEKELGIKMLTIDEALWEMKKQNPNL